MAGSVRWEEECSVGSQGEVWSGGPPAAGPGGGQGDGAGEAPCCPVRGFAGETQMRGQQRVQDGVGVRGRGGEQGVAVGGQGRVPGSPRGADQMGSGRSTAQRLPITDRGDERLGLLQQVFGEWLGVEGFGRADSHCIPAPWS